MPITKALGWFYRSKTMPNVEQKRPAFKTRDQALALLAKAAHARKNNPKLPKAAKATLATVDNQPLTFHYLPAGESKTGAKILYAWSKKRNRNGFFVSFREVRNRKGEVKRHKFAGRRQKMGAEGLARRRLATALNCASLYDRDGNQVDATFIDGGLRADGAKIYFAHTTKPNAGNRFLAFEECRHDDGTIVRQRFSVEKTALAAQAIARANVTTFDSDAVKAEACQRESMTYHEVQHTAA